MKLTGVYSGDQSLAANQGSFGFKTYKAQNGNDYLSIDYLTFRVVINLTNKVLVLGRIDRLTTSDVFTPLISFNGF